MKEFPGFDASQDAEALYNAMKGFGMDAAPDFYPIYPLFIQLTWYPALPLLSTASVRSMPGPLLVPLSSLELAQFCFSSQPQVRSSLGLLWGRMAMMSPAMGLDVTAGCPCRQ